MQLLYQILTRMIVSVSTLARRNTVVTPTHIECALASVGLNPN